MKSWVLHTAVLAALTLAGTSFGENVSMSLQSGPGGTGSDYSPGITSFSYITANLGSGNSTTYYSAGAFRWHVTSDGSPGTLSSYVNSGAPLYSFCIQSFQNTGGSYSVGSLTNAPSGGVDAGYIDAGAAAQIQGLVNSFWSALDFTNSKPDNYTYKTTPYSDDKVAAAFQLAIWEIEYDGGTTPQGESFRQNNGYDYFTHGKLKADGSGAAADAISLANAWLNSVDWTPDTAVSSYVLYDSCHQDQLVCVKNTGGGAGQGVPLPAALPGGLALMLGLGAYRKFRRSRA